jgi:hypothetical protein
MAQARPLVSRTGDICKAPRMASSVLRVPRFKSLHEFYGLVGRQHLRSLLGRTGSAPRARGCGALCCAFSWFKNNCHRPCAISADRLSNISAFGDASPQLMAERTIPYRWAIATLNKWLSPWSICLYTAVRSSSGVCTASASSSGILLRREKKTEKTQTRLIFRPMQYWLGFLFSICTLSTFSLTSLDHVLRHHLKIDTIPSTTNVRTLV